MVSFPSRPTEANDRRLRSQAILTFWFGSPNSETYGRYRRAWFVKSSAFDTQIRQQFLADIENAAKGRYDDWQSEVNSAVALLLLLDQFPRNVYRGTPQSFATDGKALKVAEHMVETGIDKMCLPAYRFFVYVPFEHQEAIASQHKAVALLTQLMAETPDIDEGFRRGLDFAIRHRDVIARFGRFPHRNEILRRKSNAEELAFLQQPGSRF